MSSPYTPYNHNAVHAEIREAVYDVTLQMLTFPPIHITEEAIEEATDSLLEVLATAWTHGFYEGAEDCCGMGALPNPYVEDPA